MERDLESGFVVNELDTCGMEVGYGSDQGKSKSASWRASAVFQPVEALEDVSAFIFGDARPVVTYLCEWSLVPMRKGEANLRAIWRMAERIFDQIDKELCEELSISANMNGWVN